MSISLFAGTTSLVTGALVSATDDLDWPVYYLIAAGAVGLVAVRFLQEPKGRRMWGSAPAAESDAAAQQFVDARRSGDGDTQCADLSTN